jgi:DNA-binding NtrC family response regulator
MPGMGLEVLRRVQRRNPDVPFILLTAHPSIPIAVQASSKLLTILIKPVSLTRWRSASIRRSSSPGSSAGSARPSSNSSAMEAVPSLHHQPAGRKILYANKHLAPRGLTPDEVKNRNTVDFYRPRKRLESWSG